MISLKCLSLAMMVSAVIGFSSLPSPFNNQCHSRGHSRGHSHSQNHKVAVGSRREKAPLQQYYCPRMNTKLNVFHLDGAFSSLDTFFQTEPYLAAFLTCSVKASAADWVAQSQQDQRNVPRNVAFILYGGFYQGCVQTFLYSVLFPAWFPDPSAQTIFSQVAIDLFILGPLVCMPAVYTMKALLAGEEAGWTSGIQKYADHVQNKGILYKYWAIWGPVQTLNFGVIPPHLRVFFVAMVSFFWICLLSTVSSSEAEESDRDSHIRVLEALKFPPSLTDVHRRRQLQQQQSVPVPVLANCFEAGRQEGRLAPATSTLHWR